MLFSSTRLSYSSLTTHYLYPNRCPINYYDQLLLSAFLVSLLHRSYSDCSLQVLLSANRTSYYFLLLSATQNNKALLVLTVSATTFSYHLALSVTSFRFYYQIPLPRTPINYLHQLFVSGTSISYSYHLLIWDHLKRCSYQNSSATNCYQSLVYGYSYEVGNLMSLLKGEIMRSTFR